MNMWLEGGQRYCDRQTAIELGGSKYKDTSIKTLYYLDEFIKIIDDNEITESNNQ